jgi:hypothetical protein
MSTYCLKCRTKTENINETTEKTKNNRIILKSFCAVCGKRKNMFLKKTSPAIASPATSPAKNLLGSGYPNIILVDD